MHIGDCIGGQVFYEEDMQTEALKPRFVTHGEVTEKVFKDPNTRILEINSKTGLYPLFMTYSVFTEKLQAYRETHWSATEVPLEIQNQIWDEVLLNHIFVICKTEMAKSITKRTLRGFRQAKVNARYFEDLINKITNQPELFISKVTNGINYWKNNALEENMKFNAIVGNPPYQVSSAGEANRSNSIYHLFIEIARKLSPEYISMITPSRWMTRNAQSIPDSWIDDMINCNHFISIYDYFDASECFTGVEIKGGVNYFLYSKNYTGPCIHRMHTRQHTVFETKGELNATGAGVVIRDAIATRIIEKVSNIEGDYLRNVNFSSLVSSQHFFGKDVQLNTSWKGYVNIPDEEHRIKYYLNKQVEPRGYGWVKLSDIPKNHETIKLHKVYFPKAGGSGNDPIVLGKPFYGEPGSICSLTYIIVGYDYKRHNFTKEQCESIISYMKTRFFRYLVSIKKKTQDNPNSVFQFVPVQSWDKMWTDDALYEKYDLSRDEIDYIESMIKPMAQETLFESEDLIDPRLGEFNILEHGVKVGSPIVYTPTGQEVIVYKDNMVEYNGEKYTLAQFTAKYMPRNKRSISGFCQGPKYFTYNGVSLYKLKESFLGGNKTHSKVDGQTEV